ncbi:MAG: DNA-binding protein [Pleurocapsa minor GSE-CHR-MK-17-07R]|jgi:predicted DNA-binding protein with PD1-like motif|nr:DNA-binding protein [Pleurocapsa minor GSE-CHR-MK 17-07R]
MITGQRVNPKGTRVYMGTITAADLHESLQQVATEWQVTAGLVTLLGTLYDAELTAIDLDSQTRTPPVSLSGTLEIVGGHATISRMADAPHVHAHLVLSTRTGDDMASIAVYAGHVSKARVHAVEFVLTAYDGVPVERAIHARSGLNLWKLPTIGL